MGLCNRLITRSLYLIVALISVGMFFGTAYGDGASVTTDYTINKPINLLAVGGAEYTYPIFVPPGRAGHTPQLALYYNSSSANGWLGIGWQLDMGAIERSKKKGVDYGANDYVFTQNGNSSELVSRSSQWGSNYYGAKIEQQYIKYYHDPSTGGWLAYHKDGNVFYYGSTSATRQINSDNSIFKWSLDKIEDANGNLIELSYDKINGTLFLSEITYDTNNRIEFVPDSAARPDQWETYETHFPVTMSERLGEIKVYGDGQFTTHYKLEYETAPSTNRSRLKTIRRYGDDDNTTLPALTFEYKDETIDPLREEISNFTFSNYIYWTFEPGYRPTYGDFNGDGLTDILVPMQDRSTIQLRINQGNGQFTSSTFGISNWEGGWIQARQWSAGDFNGDGKADVVQLGTRVATSVTGSIDTVVRLYVYYSSFDEESGEIQLSAYDEKVSFAYIPHIIIGDFNADGSNDVAHIIDGSFYDSTCSTSTIVRCPEEDSECPTQPYSTVNPWNPASSWTRVKVNGKSTFVCNYPYTPSGWSTLDINNDGRTDLMHFIPPGEYSVWGTPVTISEAKIKIWRMRSDGYFDVFDWTIPEANSPVNLNTCETWGTADFNGDGLSDLYGVIYNKLAIFFSNGQTFKQAAVVNNIADINSYKLNVGDFNGDGLQDFFGFRSNDGVLHVFISQGDGTFIAHPHSLNIPGYAQTFGFGDFDGDGKPDLLVHDENYAVRFFSTHSIGKPDILEHIRYEKGATIDLEYEPSSKYENKTLPFVIPTLSKMTINDGVDDSNDVAETSYHYGGGVYNYEDREFRGFEWAEQYNPDGGLEKTWFHQDRFRSKRPYKIALYSSKQAEEDGESPLIATNNTWEELDEDSAWGFVKLTDKTVTEYDNPAFPDDLKETYTYDNAGNLIITEIEGDYSNGCDPSMLTVTKTTPWVQKGNTINPWIWRQRKETVQAQGETAPSRDTTYTYYDNGKLETKTSGTSIWAYDYDSYGNLQYEYPPNYQDNPTAYPATEYQYDDTNTYVYKIINGKGHVVEKHWDTHLGVIDWEKDANGNITDYDYDEFGRMTTTDYPGPDETLKVFNDYCLDGDCTDVELPWKVTTRVLQAAGVYVDTTQYYDGLGRPVQTVTNGESGQFAVSKIHYDAMGLKFLETGPFYRDVDTFANWSANIGRNDVISTDYPIERYPYVRTIYDARNRPLFEQSRDNLNGVKEKSYEYGSKTVKTTDADGCFSYDSMDAFGQIVISETIYQDEDGSNIFVATRYGYNSAGDLTTVKNSLWDYYYNPDEGITTITYDVQGRKTSIDDPDLGYWQYQYDKNGNLKLQTDNKGDRIQWIFDALDRPVLKDYLDTVDASVVYQYDTAIADGEPTAEDIAANRVGYLYKMTKGGVSTVNDERDDMGREVKVTQTIEGQSPRITNYDYYANGTLKKLTYPHLASTTGSSVTNVLFPGTDLLHTVTGSDNVVYATMTNYNPTGKIGDIEFGNGVSTSYQYDGWSSRLDGITTENANGDPIMERLYYYSPAGDIEEVTDLVTGVTHTYTYDKLHRLVEELSTDDHIGIAPMDLAYEYEDPDHLHAVSNITINNRTDKDFDYDLNGNMTTGWDLTDPTAIAERSFVFNGDDMPETITHATLGTTSFLYDGDNRRVKKISPSDTTYYYSDAFEIVNGIETYYIFAGNLRIAKVTNDGSVEKVYFHKDHLGSSAVVTAADGTILEDTDYLPFGGQRRLSGTISTNYRFTDQELDSETGLYNYDARLYDPVIGRFVSADSVVPDWYDSQALNRYSYTLNNPLIYTDPSGHVQAETGLANDVLSSSTWQTGNGVLDNSVVWLINQTYNTCGYFFNFGFNALVDVRRAYNFIQNSIIIDLMGGDGLDVMASNVVVAVLTAGVTQIPGGLKSLRGLSYETASKSAGNVLQKALSKAKPTKGHPNQLMHELDDGTRVLFRKDFGEQAHSLGGPFKGKGKIDHYNVQIQNAKGKTIENLHIVSDGKGGFIRFGKDGVIK